MADPPILNHHLASAEELAKLFEEHNFAERLQKCDATQVPIRQHYLHEQFSDTKELIYFHDPETGDEVARLAEYIHVNPPKPKARIILMLRIGNDVYNLRLV